MVEALDSVRPYMESHGGNVELLGIEDGVARIRLEGSCEGCPASASTLELAIKQALDEAAPDLEGLVVEGRRGVRLAGRRRRDRAAGRPGGARPGRGRAGVVRPRRPRRLGEGELTAIEVAGIGLIVARVEGSLLAYRDACAGCGGALADGELERGRARLPVLRAPLLPPARRPLARRGPPAARARAAARRRRPAQGGARRMSEALERAPRRAAAGRAGLEPAPAREAGRRAAGERRAQPAAPARPARAATCAATRYRPDHRHVLQLDRAPDPLRVRELPGAALRRPGAAPDRHAGRLARRLRALRRALGVASQIPIGLAFFSLDSAAGGVVALYPSPAGATESELDLDAWEELGPPNPALADLEAGRRGADRQPDGRAAAARDRADRRVLSAGRPDQGELGGDLGRRRAGGGDRRASSTSCG